MTAVRTVTALGVAFALVTALYGAAVLVDLLGRAERSSARTLPVAGALALHVDSGDVSVRAGSGRPRLEVDEVTGVFGGPDVRVTRGAGGALRVDADCPWIAVVACSARTRLVVPAGLRLRVETGSGSVDVTGVRGDTHVRTGSGDVDVRDGGGDRLVLRTGSGSVAGTRVRATAIEARTGSGDVAIGAVRAPRALAAETGSGSVELTVPDVAYAVDAETGSGDEDIGVRRADGAPRRLRLRTGSGDVTVRPGR